MCDAGCAYSYANTHVPCMRSDESPVREANSTQSAVRLDRDPRPVQQRSGRHQLRGRHMGSANSALVWFLDRQIEQEKSGGRGSPGEKAMTPRNGDSRRRRLGDLRPWPRRGLILALGKQVRRTRIRRKLPTLGAARATKRRPQFCPSQ